MQQGRVEGGRAAAAETAARVDDAEGGGVRGGEAVIWCGGDGGMCAMCVGCVRCDV